MENILQRKINEVLKNYKGFLSKIQFTQDFQKELDEIMVEEKFEDEESIQILQETAENIDISIPRETVAKAVAEGLGISIVEFLSMPAETVERFIEEKKITLENEKIVKYCEGLKEQMVKLEFLKNPETFDTLDFLAKVLILVNNQ